MAIIENSLTKNSLSCSFFLWKLMKFPDKMCLYSIDININAWKCIIINYSFLRKMQ